MATFWQRSVWLRWLTRSPGFAITVLISLAVGIGAGTAVFSIIHAVLMNPYPYVSADRIVLVFSQDKAGNEDLPQLTGSQLEQLRNAKSVQSVLAQQGWGLSTTGSDVPEDVRAVFFTANASSFFGIPALLGRGLIPSDAADAQDSQLVAVLSYSFWQKHFAGSAGQRLRTVRTECDDPGGIILPMLSKCPTRRKVTEGSSLNTAHCRRHIVAARLFRRPWDNWRYLC